MAKEKTVSVARPTWHADAPPRRAVIGETPARVANRLRVLDAATGEAVEKVIAYDMDAGTVTRYLVEGGNLVRKDNAFVTITEDRSIRVEWVEDAA